jgi:hypothetical protein
MSQENRPVWAPDEVDIYTPSPARMYDYYLGGSHNFAADRALAEETIKRWPDVRHLARANRAFLRRAVSALAADGVDQFLDLGAGIPTVGAVHEVARAANPWARTVYVDADLVAFTHSTRLLADHPHTSVVHADMREPSAVLSDPALTGLLDLSRPIAVLMLAVLPFVPEDDDPTGIVAGYRDATAPGSYLVISHGTGDYRPEEANRAVDVYRRSSHAITLRSRAEIRTLLDGYELLEPGLVDMIHWRPELGGRQPDPLGGDVTRYSMLAAVGRRLLPTA